MILHKLCVKKSMELKICSWCKKEKFLSDFSKRTSCKSTGLHAYCKECQSEKDKQRWKNATYREKRKAYLRRNHKKILTARKRYERKRRENPQWKILSSLRGRLWCALKGYFKTASTKKLLGCSLEHFKKHLELQFKSGMSWKNYGITGWHIDHIRPCASFDLTKPEEQAACFHYTNLQPLWAKDNQKKYTKIVFSILAQ
jgi:hypothetical protein